MFRISRILNLVHCLAIGFLYLYPIITESEKTDPCYDVKYSEIATLNLLQAVIFGFLALFKLHEESFLMRFYDAISFALTLPSCALLLLPSVNVYKHCEAESHHTADYKPPVITVMYIVCIFIVYCCYYLCGRPERRQVTEIEHPLV